MNILRRTGLWSKHLSKFYVDSEAVNDAMEIAAEQHATSQDEYFDSAAYAGFVAGATWALNNLQQLRAKMEQDNGTTK